MRRNGDLAKRLTNIDGLSSRVSVSRFAPGAAALVAVSILFLASAYNASAQRPFLVQETLYRGENASRNFFDRFAFTGEVLYRPTSDQENAIGTAISPDPVGYNLRFDYRLAERFDLGFIMEATSGLAQSVSVGWIALKYYRTVENANYAVRLAVDPASDGAGGFPQLDAAFLYSAPISPDVSNRYIVGIRRVRIGYEQSVPTGIVVNPPQAGQPAFSSFFSQALGWEVHAGISYSALFDPGGSNIYFAFLAEAGSYDLVAPTTDDAPASEEADQPATEFQGGVLWLRSGLEFSRPLFSVTPFLGLPVKQWTPSVGDWPSSRLRLGVRLMLR